MKRRLADPVPWGILLPPLLFFGWTLAGPNTLGNDYPRFQVMSALSLRFFASHGIEPLWYPHLAGGFPIGGLVLAQQFHLPAWLQSHLPGYWSGHALEWITARHLVLWMALHGIYYWGTRRCIGLGRATSYLLSFVLAYNASTLDAFRYGPALDALVYGTMAVVLGLAHLLRPAKSLLVLLVLATQLLLTSGYPVVIPFLLLAALLTAPLAAHASKLGPLDALRRGAEATAAALLGGLLAAPNLAALADYLEVNHVRIAHPTLAWATQWAMPPMNPLLSAVLPWAADVHSSLGGSTLFVLVLVMLLAWAVFNLRRRFAVPLLLAFPFVYALGASSPVFRFFFEHVPGFASLRVPGRILSIVPLLVFGIVLGAVGRPGHGRPDGFPTGALQQAARWSALLNGGLCSLGLALVVTGLAREAIQSPSPAYLTSFWSLKWQLLWLLLGLGSCVAFRVAAASTSSVRALMVCTMLQLNLTMAHGTWVEERAPSPDRGAFEAVDQLPFYGQAPFWADSHLRENGEGSATVAYTRFVAAAGGRAGCYLPVEPATRKVGVRLPFYLSENVVCTQSWDEALARLTDGGACFAGRPLTTFVTETGCDGPRQGRTSRATVAAGLLALNAKNRLVVLTPNRVTLVVAPPRDAVLVTAFPETPQRSATIDGRPAPFVLVDGAFLGLRVPAGPHRVTVTYFSQRVLRGVQLFLLTTLGLVLAALVATVRALSRSTWVTVAVVVLGLVAGTGLARAIEQRFIRAAQADVLLQNSYAELLASQLKHWAEQAWSARPAR